MKKNLNILSSALKSNGYNNASVSITSLIKTLDDTYDDCYTKAAESSSEKNLQLFLDHLGVDEEDLPKGSEELEKWMRIIEDYDKIPYRVEKFHEISESVAKKILTPLLILKQKLDTAAPQITEEDKALSKAILSSHPDLSQSDIPSFMREANIISKEYNLLKFASSNDHVNNYILRNHTIAHQYESFALNKLALQSPAEQADTRQSFMSKLVQGDKAKAAARAAGKNPGFWQRVLPGFGLLFSVPLALKNIHEAYVNGKKIAEELPLEKYNINKSAALTGNPLLLSTLVTNIKDAINKNKDDPENLYEILEIVKTISAYWLDFIFSITNVLMIIIDLLSIVAVVMDGMLPIGDVAAGFFGFFLSIGLAGVEYTADHYMNKFWKKQTDKIKYIAEKKAVELGAKLKLEPGTQLYDVPDFMSKN